jgi:hypothetical protein
MTPSCSGEIIWLEFHGYTQHGKPAMISWSFVNHHSVQTHSKLMLTVAFADRPWSLRLLHRYMFVLLFSQLARAFPHVLSDSISIRRILLIPDAQMVSKLHVNLQFEVENARALCMPAARLSLLTGYAAQMLDTKPLQRFAIPTEGIDSDTL